MVGSYITLGNTSTLYSVYVSDPWGRTGNLERDGTCGQEKVVKVTTPDSPLVLPPNRSSVSRD